MLRQDKHFSIASNFNILPDPETLSKSSFTKLRIKKHRQNISGAQIFES